MNRVSAAPNDSATHERQTKGDERQSRPEALASEHRRVATLSRSARIRPLTIVAIVVFWGVWYLAYTAFGYLNMPDIADSLLLPRSLIAIGGVVISLAIAAVVGSFRRRQLSLRALVAVGAALLGTVVHTFITQEVWNAFFPDEQRSSFWVAYPADLMVRIWFFAAISAIILAFSYVDDVHEREERISALQVLAHDAQLRALRNQLNPHFLFNALNSVAGLMSRNRVREAETMIENLADFLRATLALDPQKLITLAEEISLEELYLDIEKVRFPDRLNVTIDIPEALKNVLVPSLITQPLIENSMKFAVARSTEPVELRVAAAAHCEHRFSLVIEDHGSDADVVGSKGASVGIGNVAERLKAHFGDGASIQCTRTNSGFRNMLLIPIRVT